MNLKDLKNKLKNKVQTTKVKEFTKEHKGIIMPISLGVLTCISIILIRKRLDIYSTEYYKAGHRIADIADTTAMMNILGEEKTKEVMQESFKIQHELAMKLDMAKVSPKQFNRMHENNLLGLKNVLNGKTPNR